MHNAYGALQAASSFAGLSRRPGAERPFLLSRAFFVGSQRHGAIWSGDNSATWEHLQLAAVMVLALGCAGIPFVGADVGGFFGDPSPELLVRWYQLGAWQPFFRGHAHIEAKRREPWLLAAPHGAHVREAVSERQRLLPYWNTLWHAAASGPTEAGLPLARPLWLRYAAPADAEAAPADGAAAGGAEAAAGGAASDAEAEAEAEAAALRELLRLDTQWLLGDDLLVAPVTAPAVRSVRVLLPQAPRAAAPTLWYSLVSGEAQRGGGWVEAAAPLHVTPAWQRGGSIVPRRERVRRSALHAALDPLTLHVAPAALPAADAQPRGGAYGEAQGRVFVDAGTERNTTAGGGGGGGGGGGAHRLVSFSFKCVAAQAEVRASCVLAAAPLSQAGELASEVHVEAVLLRGVALEAGVEPRATLRLVAAGSAAWPAAEDVEVAATPHGLLLKRMRAPISRAWRMQLDL